MGGGDEDGVWRPFDLKSLPLEHNAEMGVAIFGDSLDAAADTSSSGGSSADGAMVQGGGRSNVLSWEGLRCSVQGRHHGQVLEILHGVSGSAKSGELVAIIGPSGAGKSCFMDMLAARKTVGSLSGLVTFNGARASPRIMKAVSSYVTQETSFHPTQTVLEAVLFQAQLRLDASLPFEEKVRLSKDLVAMAGLQGKENMYVGGQLPGGLSLRGLSGGQKSRLSLCCGTITNPDVLFLDEPTSGLDSLAALMIVRMVRRLDHDRSVIALATMHQPSQAIWQLFDKVMVLGKGHQLFYGTTDRAESWFAVDLGLTRQPAAPAADFILDHINVDFDKSGMYGRHVALKTFSSPLDLRHAADLFAASQRPAGHGPRLGDDQAAGLSSSVAPTSCLPCFDRQAGRQVPDLVFLAHATHAHTTFAHFFPAWRRDDFKETYRFSWWMCLFWPVVALYVTVWPALAHLLGWPTHTVTDRWDYYPTGGEKPLRVEVWMTLFQGWQYDPKHGWLPLVRRSVEEAVRRADALGVPYVALGGLNKAEWVSKGGDAVLSAVPPKRSKILRGNTMTAAATAATVIQVVEERGLDRHVVLTGATSKVGQAMALYLAHRGFRVTCVTASQQRFEALHTQLPASASGTLELSQDLTDHRGAKLWVVGKSQPEINQALPQGAVAVVFAVPDPIDPNKRPDVTVIRGAQFEMPVGSFSWRRNSILLPGNQLYACLAGGMMAALERSSDHEIGDVDWQRLDQALKSAQDVGLRLAPTTTSEPPEQRRDKDLDVVLDQHTRAENSWFFMYQTILRRNFRTYVRSLANAVARIAVTTALAVVAGLVYFRLGAQASSAPQQLLMDVAGSLFFHNLALSLLPFASQATFLYDRAFFQVENASGLYPSSAYYAATVTLEIFFNAINGLVYAVIVYFMIDYQAFVQPTDPWATAAGFVGILVLMNVLGNALNMMITLGCPNQEVAFVFAAAYLATCAIAGGLFVTFPHMYYDVRLIQYISILKYGFQSLVLLLFKDNSRVVVVPGMAGKPPILAETLIHMAQLDSPGTVGGNVLALLGFYVAFVFVGYIYLRYLYKERR